MPRSEKMSFIDGGAVAAVCSSLLVCNGMVSSSDTLTFVDCVASLTCAFLWTDCGNRAGRSSRGPRLEKARSIDGGTVAAVCSSLHVVDDMVSSSDTSMFVDMCYQFDACFQWTDCGNRAGSLRVVGARRVSSTEARLPPSVPLCTFVMVWSRRVTH